MQQPQEPVIRLAQQPVPNPEIPAQDFVPDLNAPALGEAMDVDAEVDFPAHHGDIDLNQEPDEPNDLPLVDQLPDVHIADANFYSKDDIAQEVDINVNAQPVPAQQPEQVGQFVLALQAPPVNFLPLEIQEDELMSDSDHSDNDVIPDQVDTQEQPLSHDVAASSQQAEATDADQHEVHNLQLISETQGEQASTGVQQANRVHIGMVQLLPEFDHDPVMESFTIRDDKEMLGFPSPNADGIRLWSKYFAPAGHCAQFEITQCWSDFFTLLLLNPSRFDWAKSYITSKAWNIIVDQCPEKQGRKFVIPLKCPTEAAPRWVIEEIEEETVDMHVSQQEATLNCETTEQVCTVLEPTTPISQLGSTSKAATTSTLHMKRKAMKVPIVDSDLRRSDRIKKVNNGFKGKTCMEKYCICYSTEPPTLSSKVIRNLGETLCKISPGVISDEALLHKPKTAVKKQKQSGITKGKAKNSRKNNDDKPQKKAKKN